MNNKKIGNQGEQEAISYLLKKNHKVLKKNFYCQFGEIDIICIDYDKIIHIIEVKKTNNELTDPLTKITQKKINRLINCSKVFITMYNYNNYQIQFDFLGIIKGKIKYIENIISLVN